MCSLCAGGDAEWKQCHLVFHLCAFAVEDHTCGRTVDGPRGCETSGSVPVPIPESRAGDEMMARRSPAHVVEFT